MLYDLQDHTTGKIIGSQMSGQQIEDTLRTACVTEPRKRFVVYGKITIPILAHVERNDEEGETISIESGEVKVRVRRQSVSQKDGELSVSCSPRGRKALVDSFNLEFRPYNDPLTDRGLVWVLPNRQPNILQFAIVAEAAQESGRVIQIITEAAETVEQQLLKRLIPTPTLDTI